MNDKSHSRLNRTLDSNRHAMVPFRLEIMTCLKGVSRYSLGKEGGRAILFVQKAKMEHRPRIRSAPKRIASMSVRGVAVLPRRRRICKAYCSVLIIPQ